MARQTLFWGLTVGMLLPSFGLTAEELSPSSLSIGRRDEDSNCKQNPLGLSCGQVENRLTSEFVVSPRGVNYLSGTDASISVNVTRSLGNRPPQLKSADVFTALNTPVFIPLLASDPDDDRMTISVVVPPTHGDIELEQGKVRYTPKAGFSGVDAFGLAASDERRMGLGAFQVQVGPRGNQPPRVVVTPINLTFGQTTVVAPDISDRENDKLVVTHAYPSLRGSVTPNSISFLYDPKNTYGQDQFFVIVHEATPLNQVVLSVVSINVGDPSTTSSIFDKDPASGATAIASAITGLGTLVFPHLDTTHYPTGLRSFYLRSVDVSGQSSIDRLDYYIDNEPPSLRWLKKPVDNSCVSGMLVFEVNATDKVGIRAVRLISPENSINEIFLGGGPRFTINFDSRRITREGNGSTFQLQAIDLANMVSTTTLSVNLRVDHTPPEVTFVSPSNGDVIGGESMNVRVTAQDRLCHVEWIELDYPLNYMQRTTLRVPGNQLDTVVDLKRWREGDYYLIARARDEAGNISPDRRIDIGFYKGNRKPIANAGESRTVGENSLVTLDGTQSRDPEGGRILYNWSQIRGPRVELSDTNSAQITFVAPFAGPNHLQGLAFQLIVFDGLDTSFPSTVRIYAEDRGVANQSPLARTGAAKTAKEMTVIQLDGTSSVDPEGSGLEFAWQQREGPPVVLNDRALAAPSFLAPTVNAETALVFELKVRDDQGSESLASAEQHVTIQKTGDTVIEVPVANAGDDQSVPEGSLVTLNGNSSSDPAQKVLTYHWRQVEGPPVEIMDSDKDHPSFTAPNVVAPTTCKFELIVTNSDALSSVPDIVDIQILNTQNENHPPVAVITGNAVVKEGQKIILDGQLSYDPEGTDLTYEWEQVSGPVMGSFSHQAASSEFYSAPLEEDESYIFRLTVKDKDGNPSVPVTKEIRVTNDVNVSVAILEPDDNSQVSGIRMVETQVFNFEGLPFSQLQLFIGRSDGMAMKSSGNSSVLAYAWNTRSPSTPDGVYWICSRAIFDGNHIFDKWSKVTVINATRTDPPTVDIFPFPSNFLKGEVSCRAAVSGEFNTVYFLINGTDRIPAQLIDGQYWGLWDTESVSGPATVVAVAEGPGGTIPSETLSVTVDNADPAIILLEPSQERADAGLFGNETFRVSATDNDKIDHVEFWFESEFLSLAVFDPSNLYSFSLDTRRYADSRDGHGDYSMTAIAFDRAGNKIGTPTFSFKIDNANPPRSGVRIIPHPADPGFAASSEDARIYAEFDGQINVSSIRSDSIRVHVKKNGVVSDLAGEARYDNETGRVIFPGEVPDNSEVTWDVANVRDAENRLLDAKFHFYRGFSKATGGEVVIANAVGQLKLIVPPNASSEDLFIQMEDHSNDASFSQPSEPSAQGNIDIRPSNGPFRVFGVNVAKETVLKLNSPATLIYSELAPPSAPEELTRQLQVQSLDGTAWVPAGLILSRTASSLSGTPGAREIQLPVQTLGTFRIASIASAAPGVSQFGNFPNPFNPNRQNTTFEFLMDVPSDVQLVIFDLFGNLVNEIHYPIGTLSATGNYYQIPWNGRNGSGHVIANGGYLVDMIVTSPTGAKSKSRIKVGVVK